MAHSIKWVPRTLNLSFYLKPLWEPGAEAPQAGGSGSLGHLRAEWREDEQREGRSSLLKVRARDQECRCHQGVVGNAECQAPPSLLLIRNLHLKWILEWQQECTHIPS